MRPHTTLSDMDIERQAQRRAAARMGWLVHAMVYVAVNTLLFTLAWLGGRNWAVYPLMGWGLGLLLHGLVVWLLLPHGRLYQHLLQQERQRLQPLRDPW